MKSTIGLAVRCDLDGNIVEIFHLSPSLHLNVQKGAPFTRLAIPGSLSKALSFLLDVKAHGIASNWEIDLQARDHPTTITFMGALLGESILISGSDSGESAKKMYSELVRINNEQTNRLRDVYKTQAHDYEHYDKISKLNNELMTLQRELAKKNAELEQLYADARQKALIDSLTGIYNRGGFFELGEHEFRRAKRTHRALAAIMFDIDHFKKFNDSYGHLVGDKVLKETAARCGRQLRECDIFGRFGGDEFAALLPETDRAAALLVAERLRAAVGEPIIVDQRELLVSISLGVAVRSDVSVPSLEALLRDADTAMYRAKTSGRDQVGR